MTTLLTIVVLALAFQAGLATAWVIAERYFMRPMRRERDKAVKAAKRAADMAQLAMMMHSKEVAEKRAAKKKGLILSPIQVQFPGERDD